MCVPFRKGFWATLALGLLLCGGLRAQPPAPPGDEVSRLIAQLPGGGMKERLAARNAVRRLVRIGRPAVPALIEATRHRDPWARSWAGQALGQIGDPRAAPALKALLRDPNTLVRCVATYYLGRFARDDPALATAIADQMKDESADVRRWAHRSLTERKLTAALGRLETLQNDPRPETRRQARVTACALRGRSPVKEALALLQGRRTPQERADAYAILREHGQARVEWLDLFLKGLDEPGAEAKAEAVQGVRWVLKECQKEIAREKWHETTDLLSKKLPAFIRSDHETLRAHSLYLLTFGRREALLPQILDLLKNDPSPLVRAYAVQALTVAGVKDDRVTDAIVRAMEDEDEAVRHWAGLALRWVTDGACPVKFSHRAPAAERARQVEAIRRWRAQSKAGPSG